MKRITFRLMVAVLAFAIGILSVRFIGLHPRIEDFVEDKLIVRLVLNLNLQPRFKPSWRACGRGYRQGYTLSDGQSMSEGSLCYDSPAIAREQIQTLISKSSKVVEKIPSFQNGFGQVGERIVLVYPPNERGNVDASILWYGGNDCFLYIDAPSLDIALEFEKANAYAY
jgi:hypothetical protein